MFLVFIISSLVAFGIARLYIPVAYVGWDESVFLYWAYKIYSALRLNNFSDFWQITRMQFEYPPLQSWAIGIPLLPFGFTIEGARIVGLCWFVAGSLLIWAIGSIFDRGKHKIIGIISALLFMTSPLVILYAGLAFKELMGATLTLAVLLVYFLARKTGRVLYYLAGSIMLIFLCMTKYNYGAILVIAILIEASIEFITGKKRKAVVVNHLIMFLPAATCMFWWVFYPVNRFPQFLYILQNPGTIYPMLELKDSWGYVIYYPYAVLLMSGVSILIGGMLLVALFLAIFHLRDTRIRTLWILFILNIVLGEMHHGNMQERYLITTLPALFIIGSYIAVDLYTYVKKSLKSGIAVSVLAVVLGSAGVKVAYDVWHLPQYVYAVGSFTHKSALFNQKTIIDRWFYYDDSQWAKRVWPEMMKERPQDVADYVTSHVDVRKPVNVVGRANELPPNFFTLEFALSRESNAYPKLPYPSYVVTIEILPHSIYDTNNFHWFNAYLIPEIRQVERDPSLTLLSSKMFSELGVSVHIYVPKTPVL